MTLSLSFSRSIPIFLVIQTIIFLLFLKISEKVKTKSTPKISSKIPLKIASALYAILIIGVVATILFKFRDTIPYTAIIMLTPVILVPLIALGFSCKLMLGVIILWHFMLIAPEMPSDLLAITEGAHMTRTIILYERWIPEMAHNPSYNPFPTIAFVKAMLSLSTGIPWFDWGMAYILIVAVMLAFDLAIYVLTSRLSSDNSAGLLAIIIATLTPYLLVTSHAYQVPANAMWLLCILTFIKSLENMKRSDAISRIILFSSAILTHPTAYIAMMLPPIFLLVTWTFDREFLSKHPHIKSASLSFIVIGMFRFIYEELYARYVGRMFFDAIKDLVSRTFIGEEFELKLSLYEYGGIPFYQAFLWSLTASLAFALILYYILKKSINPIIFSFFITASIFITIGYIMATMMSVGTNLYRGQYVAFSLLVPLAALTIKKILDPRSKYLVVAIALLFLLGSYLALSDPEISYRIAAKVRGIPEVIGSMGPTPADLMKAENIMSLMKDIRIANNLVFYSEASISYERVTTYGKYIPVIYGKIQDAWYKVLYVHGYTTKDTPIVSINSVTTDELFGTISKYDMIYSTKIDCVFWKD